MLELTKQPPIEVDPILRSYIYHLLAKGFKYPTLELFEQYQSGQFLQDLFAQISGLPYLTILASEEMNVIKKACEDLQKIEFQEFEVRYVAAFDVGFPEPPCPPYEGNFVEKAPKTETMLEVFGFYKHFGLSMNQEEGKRELPDYLCAELEFMHFLAFKEAKVSEGSDEELLRGYILAQKDFLERHLTRWFPKFFEKVLGVEDLSFYPELARITLDFITSEYALMCSLVKGGR